MELDADVQAAAHRDTEIQQPSAQQSAPKRRCPESATAAGVVETKISEAAIRDLPSSSTVSLVVPKQQQPPPPQQQPSSEGSDADINSSEPKAQKKRKRKVFLFGNYDAYYNYRRGPVGPEHRAGDPRLQLLQRAWFEGRSVLDIGCNSGLITFALAEQFAPRSILGVDIDGNLIRRANSRLERLRQTAATTATVAGAAKGSEDLNNDSRTGVEKYPLNIEFRTENFVARKHRRRKGRGGGNKTTALASEKMTKFEIVLCLSVTKWIHLNWGDAGLKTLFRRVWESLPTDGTGLFILEPQPWSSYKKKYCLSETTKANYKAIQIRPDDFTTYLTQTVGFELLETLLPSLGACASKGFKRPLHVYRRPPQETSISAPSAQLVSPSSAS